MILESIGDVMLVLSSDCPRCLEFWGDVNPFTDVKAEGDKAIFTCRRGDSYETIRRFNTSKQDFNKLAKEFQEHLKYDPVDAMVTEYRERTEELIAKAQTYATFSPENFKYEFPGICGNCGDQVPMSIRDQRLWTSCSPCASLMADSMSG